MPAKTDISPETGNGKRAEDCFFRASAEDFKKIPGSPIAYWVSEQFRKSFADGSLLEKSAPARLGMTSSDNARFVRSWSEIDYEKIGLKCDSEKKSIKSEKKWFPYNKGGDFRKWFGNNFFLINWENGGKEVLDYAKKLYGSPTRTIRNIKYFFKKSITWSFVSSSCFGVRTNDEGFIFDVGGSSSFPEEKNYLYIISLLASCLSFKYLSALNPTLNFQAGNIGSIPVIYAPTSNKFQIEQNASNIIQLSKNDWDAYENSWNFKLLRILSPEHKQASLSLTFSAIYTQWNDATIKVQRLEEENNRIFLKAYGLQDEFTPDVPLKEITLTCNPYYRYGNNKSEQELENLLRADTMKELISYAIGCMMGRYSLDKEGLIYAHAGNESFDPSRYTTFPADEDGIVPVMDSDWFEDDASKRFEEFLRVTWNKETLEENLKFVADSLAPKRGEEPRETIRRFISTSFFKDHHLKVYKKRPIYWLFSSGKNKAFECLVYLHRYNEKTLSRMRAMYVTPLQGKFNATIEYLQKEKDEAPSTSASRTIQKQLTTMLKKQEELRAFDELLRHYADQRITLDLDDGVKVNYGKFGKLLAEVKAVTGEKAK